MTINPFQFQFSQECWQRHHADLKTITFSPIPKVHEAVAQWFKDCNSNMNNMKFVMGKCFLGDFEYGNIVKDEIVWKEVMFVRIVL